MHLTLPTEFRIRRAVPERLALHYADLKLKDLRQVEGVPVTTAARAIRDAHASHLGPALIRQAIHDGRRTGHLTVDEAELLEQELLGMKPRRQKRRGSAAVGWRSRQIHASKRARGGRQRRTGTSLIAAMIMAGSLGCALGHSCSRCEPCSSVSGRERGEWGSVVGLAKSSRFTQTSRLPLIDYVPIKVEIRWHGPAKPTQPS